VPAAPRDQACDYRERGEANRDSSEQGSGSNMHKAPPMADSRNRAATV